jgi:hypothetical protein
MIDAASSRILGKHMDEQIQPIMNVAEEKTWPVILYRCESDGWKKQEFVTTTAASSSIISNTHQVRKQHFVAVAPRKDCIVFPHLRQRFSLKSDTDQGTVIRRDDKILLTSKRRMRALLLQFQSLQDCLDFSDRFLMMNNPPLPLSSFDEEDVAACAQNDLERIHGRQPASSDEQEQVVSYITRLLHDEEFLRFVHKVETYIARTDDGSKILRGLEELDLSSI